MLKRPFLIMGASSFFAALLLPFCSIPAICMLLMLIALCGVLVLLVPLPRAGQRAALLSAVSVLLTGFLYLGKDCAVVQPACSFDGQTVQADLLVLEPASAADAYIAEVQSGGLPAGLRLCVWVGDNEAAQNGDLLSGSFTLTTSFGGGQSENALYARAHDVYLCAWPSSDTPTVCEIGRETLSLTRRAVLAVREFAHDAVYDRLPSDKAALCERMLLGVRGGVSFETEQAFRQSGVIHLLVVSGLHLSILSGSLLWLLKVMHVKRWPRAVLTMLGVLLFMTVCGFSSAVLRAGIMTLLLLSALLFHRRADGLNSLGAAAFLMLLCDPFAACDIGMQLSFAATAGLLICFPVWERAVTARVLPHHKAGRFLRPVVSAAGISLCAVLAVLPLTALYFGEIPVFFLAGNLLCVLPAEMLMLLCAGAVLFSGLPFLAPLTDALFWFAQRIGDWLFFVTGQLSSLPFTTIVAGEPYLIVWLFGVTLLLPVGYALLRRRGVCYTAAALAVILLTGLGTSAALHAGFTAVTVTDTKTISLFVQDRDTCGLLFSGDGQALRTVCGELRQKGVRRLSWVVWLNEPSPQSTDLSALTLPIDTLLLRAPPEAYANLPEANRILLPAEDESVAVSGQKENPGRSEVTLHSGFIRLTIGDTAFLLCPPSGNTADLPDTWRSNQVLIYQKRLPLGADSLRADAVICFCEAWERPAENAAAPCEATTLLVPARDGPYSLHTRGDGAITVLEAS